MSKKCVCGNCSKTKPLIKRFPKERLQALLQQIKDLKIHSDFARLNIPFDSLACEVEKQFTTFGNCDMSNVLVNTLAFVGYLDHDQEGRPVENESYFEDDFTPSDALDFVFSSYTKTVTQLQAMKCKVIAHRHPQDTYQRWNNNVISYRRCYDAYGYLTYYEAAKTWHFLIREFDIFRNGDTSQATSISSRRTKLILNFCLECKRAGIDQVEIETSILSPAEINVLRLNGFVEDKLSFLCDLSTKSFQSLKHVSEAPNSS